MAAPFATKDMKTYRAARWYDAYPRLQFALDMLRLLPPEQQWLVADACCQFVMTRSHTVPTQETAATDPKRWSDKIGPLRTMLNQLQTAPAPVIQQTADYLNQWLQG